MDGQQTNSYENLERTTCDTTGEVKSIKYILDHKDEVCFLYSEGYSIREVSSIVGIGRDMVHDILLIYGKL